MSGSQQLILGVGAGGAAPTYIEDVFSTWLYTGNGSTQTITNGIDLSTKGGLVWMKSRNVATDNALYDTARGATFDIASNLLDTQTTQSTGLTSFGSTGFSIGSLAKINTNSNTYVSWTFRKQPKFFDVVTYTGNGVGGRTVAHNLGSVPGCIIVKRLDGAIANWAVYHRSLGNTERLFLNSTFSQSTDSSYWNNTNPSSTVFTVGTNPNVNDNGSTYVAYLFAHDAGGFGLTGTDSVISCGSWVGDGSVEQINLGWEPQFLLYKAASVSQNWFIRDNMRGWGVDITATSAPTLNPNNANAEGTPGGPVLTSTGFQSQLGVPPGSNYIYIAIRRGPMKTPTSGTSVFAPAALNNAVNTQNTTNFPIDLQLSKWRGGVLGTYWLDRLRGLSSRPSSQSIVTGPYLQSSSTAAEVVGDDLGYLYDNTSWRTGSNLDSPADMAYWNFRRAPGFFDVVCYTGTGVNRTVNHNLGVVPELMIFKRRNATSNWTAFYSIGSSTFSGALVNLTNAGGSWNYTDSAGLSAQPTSTTVALDGTSGVNASGSTYVAYLFASCPGVSKVGSYTGNGSSQTINMGFTGGARFFLVKRTDSTGDWWVYDSARGIVANSDPALALNSTAAEVTSADAVDTASVGLIVNQESTCNINVNGATYIYLGIA